MVILLAAFGMLMPTDTRRQKQSPMKIDYRIESNKHHRA